jgi:hypothetical protein
MMGGRYGGWVGPETNLSPKGALHVIVRRQGKKAVFPCLHSFAISGSRAREWGQRNHRLAGGTSDRFGKAQSPTLGLGRGARTGASRRHGHGAGQERPGLHGAGDAGLGAVGGM